VGNSVTGNRTRILSPVFADGASKLDRTWDVIGGEGKVWKASVCLSETQRQELLEEFPELQLSRHVSIANMRYILHRYLDQTTLVHVREDGEETRVRAPVKLVIGDIKSLCIHMGQDNKCPCCELPYESYDRRLYGAQLRTPESNLARWENHLDDVAKIVGAACSDNSFASSLTKVNSVETLAGKLAEAEEKFGLLEVRLDVARRLETFRGGELFVGEEALGVYDGAAKVEPGYRGQKDPIRVALLTLKDSIAALSRPARGVLLGRTLDQQMDLLACCACELGTGIAADLGWVRREKDAKELLKNVEEAEKKCGEARERFARIRAALQNAADVQGLWLVLEDRELPGLGFRGKGESAEAAKAADLSPIARTRMQTLVKFIKARNAHVTGRPVDFLSDWRVGEELACPEVVPGIMHTCHKVGKKILKLLQKEAFGSAEGPSNKESNLEYVGRQIALVKTELLVKDEEKAGDNISMAMNFESIRLIFNHWKDMFGDLLNRQWAVIAELLSSVYSILYSSLPPTESYALFLWVASNLTWNLTRILDQLASVKEKKDRKPVVQSNHFHAFGAELPRVYEKLQPTLSRLGALFQLLTEEAGEALQKVAKVEGYNHSDRKTNVIDTMYRGEQMRDWAIMAYSSGAQDCSAAKPGNKRFAATTVPNLAVSSCVYSQNPVFRSTFLSLAASLATKEISKDGFYVYTPPSVDPTAHFVTVRKPSTSSASVFQSNFNRARDCSCTCHCKCPDCRPLCPCGCPADCSCLLDSNQCRCLQMPLILICVGGGPGQQSFLPVKWCNSELPPHISAAVEGLLPDRPPGSMHEADVLQWQRQPSTADGSSLLPGVEYMRQQAQSKIQASATAFLLRKHLLPTARLRLSVFGQGEWIGRESGFWCLLQHVHCYDRAALLIV
jgi:hypothetical protein